MSSQKNLKKLGRKRNRKERHQLERRRHLGFLEHHKDYKIRAEQHHQKEKKLQHLKLIASLRNPDEFHSDMAHTQIRDGKIIVSRESKLTKEKIKNIDDADSRYMTMRVTHEMNKLKRDIQTLHCLDVANQNNNNNNNDKKKNNNNLGHTIYFNNDKDRRNFEASKHFNTPKALLNMTHNRVKTSQLGETGLKLKKNDASDIKNLTRINYAKIKSKINKLDSMKKHLNNINLKRKLQSGDKYLIRKKKDINTGRIIKRKYKWIKERKR